MLSRNLRLINLSFNRYYSTTPTTPNLNESKPNLNQSLTPNEIAKKKYKKRLLKLKSSNSTTSILNQATEKLPYKRDSKYFDQVYKNNEPIFKQELSTKEIKNVILHNTIFSWNPTETATQNALVMERGEGVYFYTPEGKKYIDFNSQAMCSNIGHTVPKEVTEAVMEQLSTAPYAYPCSIVTPIKAKLSTLLADILPGNLNHLYYVSGGAEANETAMRMARLFTGKHKILARYRSYHGATLGAMSLTGDPRRLNSEPGASGIVHFMDPFPLSFKWGKNEKDICKQSLKYLEEVIQYEGPNKIAAIFIESITGTNGILVPPNGYLNGIRNLCDKYNILLVCDEVMNGFGRTGKMFGFEHGAIIPDIVTMAKGINGAYLPLGALACTSAIAKHFKTNGVGIGSTYNSHPVTLASAYGALQYFLKNDILGNVVKMEPILKSLLNSLKKHPSVKGVRSIGLFGIVELRKNNHNEPFVEFNSPSVPAIAELQAEFHNQGIYTLFRWSSFFTNPPLTINEQELTETFSKIDKALDLLDKHYTFIPPKERVVTSENKEEN